MFVLDPIRNPRVLPPRRKSRSCEIPGYTSRKAIPLGHGEVRKHLTVPDHICRPPYVGTTYLPEIPNEIQIHDDIGIRCMKSACELAARVLEFAGTLVQPCMTTDDIDKAAHEMIVNAGAYPSPLGYGGFPKSICTSVNECMFHGIPDSRPLKDGDMLNIDVTVYLHGYHGDTSRTFLCGEVDQSVKQLVKVTEECMMEGISLCKDGASFDKIGEKICKHADKYGYCIDRFIGHGIGKVFHSQPLIWKDCNHHLGRMIEGQTFTIEPILTMGSSDFVVCEDGWTALTTDGSLSAQFEHTVLVTRTGFEILTKF